MRFRWLYVLLVIILLAVGALACALPGVGKPTVVINSPPSDYEASEGQTLVVEVSAKGGGNIERVELLVDDALADVATNPSPQAIFNAQLEWAASGVGSHTLQVKAYNTDGLASNPMAIVVNVVQGVALATPSGGEGEPEVFISSPPSDYEMSEGELLVVDVSAQGAEGIERVELWVDGAMVDLATNPSPQPLFNAQLEWTASGVGKHTLWAKASDGSKQVGESAIVAILVVGGAATLSPEAPTPTQVPPTVAPTASGPAGTVDFEVYYGGYAWCGDETIEVAFRIENTGGVALESMYVEVQGPVGTHLGSGTQNKAFHNLSGEAYPECLTQEGAETLDPGAVGYFWLSIAQPPWMGSGHALLMGCSEDDEGGSCKSVTLDYTY